MDFKASIKEAIAKQRPNLSDKSITAYVSTLSNLGKKIPESVNNLEFFFKTEPIMDYLKNIPFHKRKSILCPLFILTDDKIYQEGMTADLKVYNETQLEQIKTETEESNWLSWNDILYSYNLMEKRIAPIYKFANKSKEDMEEIARYILLSFYVLMPPRRALDFALLKWNSEEDNVVDLKEKNITFRKYKTNKIYGTQTFSLPDKLVKILTKWKKINKTNEVIPMGETVNPSSTITHQLNLCFKPKKISVNMIRHSFLTNFYSNGMPPLTELDKMAKSMGHSVEQSLKYIRNE